jgi:hypothetical protein
LDRWDPTLIEVMTAVGNGRANAIWEKEVAQMEGWVKPAPGADLEAKENWIQTKYVWHGVYMYKEHAMGTM